MFAAPVWHFWIGLILFVASVGGVLALAGGYLKVVSSQRFPSGKRRKNSEL